MKVKHKPLINPHRTFEKKTINELNIHLISDISEIVFSFLYYPCIICSMRISFFKTDRLIMNERFKKRRLRDKNRRRDSI